MIRIMINNSKSTEKFIKKNTNQLRLKLQNKKSEAETKFAKLLSKANIYFMREKTNYKFGTRWCFFDFWIPKLRIYVEIDGAEHNTAEQQQIDREKEKIINDKQMRLFFQLRSSHESSAAMKTPFNMSTTQPFVSLLKVLRPELEDDEAIILAYSIIGEQLFFFYHRPSVLAQLGLTEYSAASVRRIRKVLVQRLERELDARS